MSMETVMKTQLADISQKMMDTLRKDQAEINNKLNVDMKRMQNDMQMLHSGIEKTNQEFAGTAEKIRYLEQGQKDFQTYVLSNQEEMKRGQECMALAAEAATYKGSGSGS